ncbi:hypothetical protein M1951_26000, partial [Klebsiella pneumoniae]|nr:hypothetical protein [Klebsiella pneumoniae]
RNAGQPCRPVARLCITLPSDRRVQKNLTTTTPPLSAFSALLFFSTGKQLLIEHVKKDSHIGVFPRR